MNKHKILVVDDEKVQRDSLGGFLHSLGYESAIAADAEEALDIVKRETIDIVLSDHQMPGKSGFELLLEIKKINPEVIVIIITAYAAVADAVSAMKSGAFDYLTKPIDLDELELLIKRALNLKILTSENRELRRVLKEKNRFQNIITNSSLMEQTLNIAARSAESRASILILGESGSGKELIARAVHFASGRVEKPLITVNCAAISEQLLESELFGHEKGSFTGAIVQKKGRVELADGGTLFLDEVGDIPMSVQVKLLRFLQFGDFERVGGNQTYRVDVRIIAATNRDLQRRIRDDLFREDFFYRLNVITINVPALRARREDIPILAEHFIKKYSKQNDKAIEKVSREALDFLMKYDFPGNVRELENIIERAVVLCRGTMLTQEDLPLHLTAEEHSTQKPTDYYPGSFKEKTEAFEKDLILEAIDSCGNNQTKAAESLGLTERTVRYKLKKYGLKE